MNDKPFAVSQGTCIISEEVIATIAGNAAMEVAGVAGMAQRPADLADIRGLMEKGAARSVKVLNTEIDTVLDVYVNLCTGAKIHEVAPQVQRQVKNAVQSMTAKPVTRVNVYVCGIAEAPPAAQ